MSDFGALTANHTNPRTIRKERKKDQTNAPIAFANVLGKFVTVANKLAIARARLSAHRLRRNSRFAAKLLQYFWIIKAFLSISCTSTHRIECFTTAFTNVFLICISTGVSGAGGSLLLFPANALKPLANAPVLDMVDVSFVTVVVSVRDWLLNIDIVAVETTGRPEECRFSP
tara:strand:+ start:13000 stop:13515 length:516 start_codon:yes stop_codon:yes gene_type:complete